MSVQGRDLLTGKPKQVEVSFREIAKALDKSIQRIEDAIMETLSQTPPELAADIYNTGIYLAGGGSMLRGLDKRISQKTDLPVYIAEDPLKRCCSRNRYGAQEHPEIQKHSHKIRIQMIQLTRSASFSSPAARVKVQKSSKDSKGVWDFLIYNIH
jgi:actin-like ATPase involved in cell morphogenesis